MFAPRRSVNITFVSDDDVIRHIQPIHIDSINCKSTQDDDCTVQRLRSRLNDFQLQDEIQASEVFQPSQALSESTPISGNELFGFKSQRKHKALEAVTPTNTPRGRTPKSSAKSKEPLRKNKRSHLKRRIESSTPSRLQARNKREVESSDDTEVSSSESEEENKDEILDQENDSTKAKQQSNVEGNAEIYFDLHERCLTSDHTLAKLSTPRLDPDAVRQALHGVRVPYEADVNNLNEKYKSNFTRWMNLLCHDYSLLLHGLGSKRRLLEMFRKEMLIDFDHLVVNGYFPSLTIKTILNAITEEALESSDKYKTPLDQCQYIKNCFERPGESQDFFLIIHNIDGAMLRSDKTQNLLSHLAAIKGFHLIASIDHISAPLMWDQAKLGRFRWLHADVTSFEAYTEETAFESSLLVQQSGGLALSSLTHVYQSLTPNAQGIFLLLVKYQLSHSDVPTYTGLAFPDLYQKCREAFLVNSDLTLRTQLTEFRDHKLLATKKIDGVEHLTVPLDAPTLTEFLEEHQSNDS